MPAGASFGTKASGESAPTEPHTKRFAAGVTPANAALAGQGLLALTNGLWSASYQWFINQWPWPIPEKVNRGDTIRTCDPVLPEPLR